MPGRKRLPTTLKKLKGTAQTCRLNKNEPKVKVVTLKCPAYLDKQGKKAFKELAALLADMKVTAPSDQKSLGILADNYSMYLQMRAIIQVQGPTYSSMNAQGDEYHRTRPEVGVMHSALKVVLSKMSEFGLTPSSRSKVSATGSQEADPFNEYRQRGVKIS